MILEDKACAKVLFWYYLFGYDTQKEEILNSDGKRYFLRQQTGYASGCLDDNPKLTKCDVITVSSDTGIEVVSFYNATSRTCYMPEELYNLLLNRYGEDLDVLYDRAKEYMSAQEFLGLPHPADIIKNVVQQNMTY